MASYAALSCATNTIVREKRFPKPFYIKNAPIYDKGNVSVTMKSVQSPGRLLAKDKYEKLETLSLIQAQ